MIITTFAVLMLSVGPALAQAPQAAEASSLVGTSTQTISSLYTGDRVRDPFLPVTMGGGAARVVDPKDEESTVVDIHALVLRGILKDSLNDFALFSSEAGRTYMLRAGKFFNDRNKLMPGITGRIRLKQKIVELITADKDVQVFRMGQEEKEKEKP
ncbi:MAG: hypothetical protein AAB036_03135 [Elusimicrobiota bacterium]